MQLPQWHLILTVAHNHGVDRHAWRQPTQPLLLLLEEWAQPVRFALTNQHNAAYANHPVHNIHVRVIGHGRLGAPGQTDPRPHILQCPACGTRLAGSLVIHIILQPTAENPQRYRNT